MRCSLCNLGVLLVALLAPSWTSCGSSEPYPTKPTPTPTPTTSPQTAPTPVPPVTRVSISGISPTVGLIGDTVRIAGTGFLQGATLTLDGVAARVTGVTSTVITATTPVHTAGTVDVVVTNLGGESGTLTGGYTYQVVTLTASTNRVTPGGQLSVRWVAPNGRSSGDWVGFFKVGDPSTSYLNGWWQYTNGAASGTLTLSAPTQPGEYEFRYLPDDGFIDAARSSRVTISASASLLALAGFGGRA